MNMPKVGSCCSDAFIIGAVGMYHRNSHQTFKSNSYTAKSQSEAGPQAKEPISLAELTQRQAEREGKIKTGLVPSLCDSQGKLKDEVRPYNQETTNWCWATSAQTVLEFHKEIKGQCDWVNGALSRRDCCGPRDFDSFLNTVGSLRHLRTAIKAAATPRLQHIGIRL